MLAVEKERLAREATDHHTTAIAETKRLVEEAEERAAAAEQRASEAIAQATEHRAAGQQRVRGAADPRPPRGRADRRRGPHPGRVDHRQRRRRGAARDRGRSGPRSTG